MFGLGTTELIVIGVIVFLLFGAKRIPEIGKSLGGAIREFRDVKKDITLQGEEKAPEKKEAINRQAAPAPKLEEKIKEKMIQQIPGVGQAMAAKKKIDKVKDLIG